MTRSRDSRLQAPKRRLRGGGTGPVAVGEAATGGEWSTPGWSVTWVFFLFAVFGASVDAQPFSDPVGRLFVAAETPTARLSARPGAGVLRERTVRMDHDVLAVARMRVGRVDARPAVVRLDLFDDVAFNAVVERTGPTSSGYWLSGRVEGWAPGSITLVVNGQVIAGTLRAPGATYAIRSVGDGLHAIRQLDPATLMTFEEDTLSPESMPFEDDSFQPALAPQAGYGRLQPIRPAARIRRAEAPPAEDGSRIDAMVVYTPAARDAEGGREQIEALIDLYVAETNQAYVDSGVVQRLNLVLAHMVNYKEAEPGERFEISVDLSRLVRPDDGHLDEVHRLRDRYAADVVTLVGHYRDGIGGAAGIYCWRPGQTGCLPGDPLWTPFSVVNHKSPSHAYTHELGHTMGLNHDRYAVTRCPRCDEPPEQDLRKWGPYPYAFGYVNQRALEPGAPEASRWVTIMAYGQQCEDAGIRCSHLLRFSNPDQTYSLAPDMPGDPMGVPGDDPSPLVDGPADARRTLNETRRVVANVRVAPCLRNGTRIRLQVSNGRYVVAANNGGGNVLAVGSRVGTWSELTLVDRSGGCLDAGDVVSLRTSAGFYLRATGGGGSTLDATDPRATPWARFVAGRERGTGPIRNLDSVTLQVPSGHYICAEGRRGFRAGRLRAPRAVGDVQGRCRGCDFSPSAVGSWAGNGSCPESSFGPRVLPAGSCSSGRTATSSPTTAARGTGVPGPAASPQAVRP